MKFPSWVKNINVCTIPLEIDHWTCRLAVVKGVTEYAVTTVKTLE